MSVTTYQRGNTTVVVLGHQFGWASIESVCALFQHLVERETSNVALDFQDVVHIDSSAIGATVFLFKRLYAQQRSLVILGAKGKPGRLFKMLRIDHVVPMYADLHNYLKLTSQLEIKVSSA